MANLKYCRPSDIVTALATITASGAVSADSNYGLASLYDRNPAKPCKFETNGPIRLVYDFGSARRIDAFSLPNHNLDDGLACIVALNATNSWGAPTCQANMVVGAQQLDGHRASPWADLTAASGYSAAGFRYCSLYVPANSTNIKLGETPVISRLRQFSQYVQFGGTKGVLRPFLESLETEYGVVRVMRRKIKQRSFRFEIIGQNGGLDYEDFQNLGDDAGGRALPFFIVADSGIKTDGGLYARFTKEAAAKLSAQEEWFSVDRFTLDVLEESRSIPL